MTEDCMNTGGEGSFEQNVAKLAGNVVSLTLQMIPVLFKG